MQGVTTMLKLVLLVLESSLVVKCQVIKEGNPDFNSAGSQGADDNNIMAGDVSSLVKQILSTYLADCNVILIRDGYKSIIFDSISRSLRSSYIPGVLAEVDTTHSDTLKERKLVDDKKFLCRAIVLDFTSSDEPSSALRLLERMQLFLIRNAVVIFLGRTFLAEDTLMAHALRNTVNALFLEISHKGSASDDPTFGDLVKDIIRHKKRQVLTSAPVNIDKGTTSVTIYSRCLYCNRGEEGFRKIDNWNSRKGYSKGNDLFPDQLHDFLGHQVNIVSLEFPPMIDFIRDSDEPSTTVTLQDSVDVRMLRAMAGALNFTYEMRTPWDDVWGYSTESGNWTGTVGTLQHHKADFSMDLSWTYGRNKILDYAGIYAYDAIILITQKPGPLPPYLALVRPLEGSLWVAVFVSTVCGGFILWGLQLGWRITTGEKGLSLDRAILFTWSILFEEPPKILPESLSSQMFVGWWWVYCTLITVVYRSSLIAHLSIPAMSKPIDSFEELLEADGWTWGYEPAYDSGWEWFKGNKNPTIKGIFKKMEVLEFEDHMTRALKGQHALISWKLKIHSLINAHITQKLGFDPTYIGKEEAFSFPAGWGFRRNCPVLGPITMAKLRLIEAGLIEQWMDELKGSVRKETQDEEKAEDAEDDANEIDLQAFYQEPEGLQVLTVYHLQSVFYLYLLGFSIAFLAFIGEVMIGCYDKRSSDGSPR